MDEPANSLDLQKQLELCAAIKGIIASEQITFIVVLHDLNLAARFADRIVVLDQNGKVYACGLAQTVITEKMLFDVYGVKAQVMYDREKIPVIAPICSVRAPEFK